MSKMRSICEWHSYINIISQEGEEMPKGKGPPNLDKYMEGQKSKYMNYQEAARQYGLPYWTFVTMAKEAKATWKLRKTAMVDIVKFEKYLEEQCIVNDDLEEREDKDKLYPR